MDIDSNELKALEGRVDKIIQKGAYSIDQVLAEVREIMGLEGAQKQALADDN